MDLLQDIAGIFKEAERDRYTSQNLCDLLTGREERPWADWRRGKPLSPNQLARLLKDFGIQSRSFRFESGVQRGYERDDFTDAFSRYLAIPPSSDCNTATTLSQSGETPLSEVQQHSGCSTPKNALNPAPRAECSTVALQNPQMAIEEVINLAD